MTRTPKSQPRQQSCTTNTREHQQTLNSTRNNDSQKRRSSKCKKTAIDSGNHDNDLHGKTCVSGTTNIQLPNSIVTMIIKELSCSRTDLYQCAHVNKQFNGATTPFLWRELTEWRNKTLIKHFVTTLTSTTKPTSQPLGRHIRKINVSHIGWTEPLFLRLMPHLSHLEEVIIENESSISHQSLEHLPQYCPHLATLTLTARWFPEPTFFHQLADHCPDLRHLTLYSCTDLPPTTFAILAAAYPHLETLVLIASYTKGRQQDMIPYLKTFTHLRRLRFLYGQCECVRSLVTIDPQQPIPWPRLTHLDLNHGQLLDIGIMTPFLQSHPGLVHLNLETAAMMMDPDSFLDTLAAYLPRLASLSLSPSPHYPYSAPGLRHLMVNCPTLRRLIVWYCFDLTEADFSPAKVIFNLGKHWPKEVLLMNGRFEFDQVAMEAIRRMDG